MHFICEKWQHWLATSSLLCLLFFAMIDCCLYKFNMEFSSRTFYNFINNLTITTNFSCILVFATQDPLRDSPPKLVSLPLKMYLLIEKFCKNNHWELGLNNYCLFWIFATKFLFCWNRIWRVAHG